MTIAEIAQNNREKNLKILHENDQIKKTRHTPNFIERNIA